MEEKMKRSNVIYTVVISCLFVIVPNMLIAQDPIEWGKKFTGAGENMSNADESYRMVTDLSGNVYVTGRSMGLFSDYDYVTIKYNSDGKEQWVQRYNGTGNGYDMPYSIVVDNQGNVYVTGTSQGLSSDQDFVTIKYNANGEEQWVQRYDGPVNGFDRADMVTVDDDGNVYVTGTSEGLDYSLDFLTIKYNANGIQQWEQRYNGNGAYNANDWAYFISLDAVGNVYVAGKSRNANFGDYDACLIKYNSDGVQQWIAIYDGTAHAIVPDDAYFSMTFDDSCYIYVVGVSYDVVGGENFLVVKYDTNGVQQWFDIYNGPGNDWDRALSVVNDDSGYIYVTGGSAGVNSGLDCVTIKYNSFGTRQWIQRYNGTNNGDDCARHIIKDALGNIYITGFTWNSASDTDYVTIKYNVAGEEQWVRTYNGTGNKADLAWRCGVDTLGSVYVTGYSFGLYSGNDFVTIKYNADGEEQWVRRYYVEWIQKDSIQKQNASGKYVKDGGALVAVNDSFLFAFRGNKSNDFYKYIIASDSWVKIESIPFGLKPDGKINKKFIGKGAALCYDGDSLIYATRGNGTFEFWTYNILRKRWTQKAFVPSTKPLRGGTSLVFQDGKVFLLAGSQKIDAPTNFFRYTPETNSWVSLAKAPLSPDNETYKDGSCLALFDNNIYALKGGGEHNYLYFFENSSWNYKDTIPLNHYLMGRKKTKVKAGGAMTSGAGKLYIIKGGGSPEFWSYSSGVWTPCALIPNLHKTSFPKTGAALAYADNKIWLLKGNNTPEFWSYEIHSKSDDNIQTLKSHSITNTMAELNETHPLTLSQNFPNPITTYTSFQYSITSQGIVKLKIYDASGRVVKDLVNESKQPGTYKVNWNITDNNGDRVCQGVYFYLLEFNGKQVQKKLLIVE